MGFRELRCQVSPEVGLRGEVLEQEVLRPGCKPAAENVSAHWLCLVSSYY